MGADAGDRQYRRIHRRHADGVARVINCNTNRFTRRSRSTRGLFWGSLPPRGGGTGRGVAANAALAANLGQNKFGEIWRVMKRKRRSNKQSSVRASTPLPVPPPQGGRERSKQRSEQDECAFKPNAMGRARF